MRVAVVVVIHEGPHAVARGDVQKRAGHANRQCGDCGGGAEGVVGEPPHAGSGGGGGRCGVAKVNSGRGGDAPLHGEAKGHEVLQIGHKDHAAHEIDKQPNSAKQRRLEHAGAVYVVPQ